VSGTADNAPLTPPENKIFRLIYRSHSLVRPDQRGAELEQIFRVARAKNRVLGVTGALLVYDDLFAQTLEGDTQVVRALVDRISRDPRHRSVEIVDMANIEARVFPHWAMAEVSVEGPPDISLIAARDGYTIATTRGTTPEQDRMLGMMRALLLDFSMHR
jgi:hypothetical protein